MPQDYFALKNSLEPTNSEVGDDRLPVAVSVAAENQNGTSLTNVAIIAMIAVCLLAVVVSAAR